MSVINHNFFASCRGAIANMKRSGMNEALIACAVAEIRAAAIMEERLRLEILHRDNPPRFEPWGDTLDAIRAQP